MICDRLALEELSFLSRLFADLSSLWLILQAPDFYCDHVRFLFQAVGLRASIERKRLSRETSLAPGKAL